MELNAKQKLFVDEYLVDLNGKQAAIRAGYSPHTAEQQASRLLSYAKVRDAVSCAMAERSRRTGVNQDRVIQELAKIGFLDITDVVNVNDATVKDGAHKDDRVCISSVKVKITPTETGDIVERELKMHSKIRALELIGKHLGMFEDKLSVDVPTEIRVNYDYGNDDKGGV